ncbi:hypothetical protein V8E52_007569 [Russula decolorans]
MPWQPTVHPAAPLAHASSPGAHPPSSAWSPHVPRCLAFLRRCTVGVPANDSQSHLLSHHSLDSVPETVVTAASATVSNIVGMIGTVAGLSVQTATMKVRCHCLLSVSIDQLDKADAPLILEAYILKYISLACNALSHSPTASRGIPSLSTTPSWSKNHPQVQPSPFVHRAQSTLLRCPKPSQPGPGYELYARC